MAKPSKNDPQFRAFLQQVSAVGKPDSGDDTFDKPSTSPADGESLSEITQRLITMYGRLGEGADFQPGDLVEWKPGLRNRSRPRFGEAAIVVQVLSEPFDNSDWDVSSRAFIVECLSLQIGVVNDIGDFTEILVDGRRMRKLRPLTA